MTEYSVSIVLSPTEWELYRTEPGGRLAFKLKLAELLCIDLVTQGLFTLKELEDRLYLSIKISHQDQSQES